MLKKYVNTFLRIKYKCHCIFDGALLNCINIGCGNDIKLFWKNCDLISNKEEVTKFDATNLQDLEWLNRQNAHIINCDHMIGYLTIGQAHKFFKSCHNSLQNNGKLILEFPDFNKICRLLEKLNYESPTVEADYIEIVRAIYAYDAKDAYSSEFNMQTYITAWTPEIIGIILKRIGFKTINHSTPITHGQRIDRDSRIEAIK